MAYKSQQSVIFAYTLYPTEADTYFSNVRTACQLNLAIYLLLACDMLIDNLSGGLAQTSGGFCQQGQESFFCNAISIMEPWGTLTDLTCPLCCGTLLQTAHPWLWLLALLFLLYLQNLPLLSPSYIYPASSVKSLLKGF